LIAIPSFSLLYSLDDLINLIFKVSYCSIEEGEGERRIDKDNKDVGLENSIISFILFIVFSVGYYAYFFKVYPPSVRVSDENRTRSNDVPAITQEVELPVVVLPPQGVQLPGAVLPPQGNQIGNIYNEENPLRDLLELANNPAFTDEERSVPVL